MLYYIIFIIINNLIKFIKINIKLYYINVLNKIIK